MQASPVNDAVSVLLSAYAGDRAEHVATVVESFKAARAANKSESDSLFAGFLSLCAALVNAGQPPADVADTLRATGNAISAEVGGILRVRAGFTRTKLKGAKESGAPSFSTAKVYAGIVARCIEAKAADADTYLAAFDKIENAKEAPEALHEASGLFASKNACSRLVKEYEEMRAAKLAHQTPALNGMDDAHLQAPTREELEAQLAAAREEVRQYRMAGDPHGSLTAARAERDAARADVIRLTDEARAARAEAAHLAQQVADLQEKLAAAREALPTV